MRAPAFWRARRRPAARCCAGWRPLYGGIAARRMRRPGERAACR